LGGDGGGGRWAVAGRNKSALELVQADVRRISGETPGLLLADTGKPECAAA